MNFVTLTGKLTSVPMIIEDSNGKKIARFKLTTEDSLMTSSGEVKRLKMNHDLMAWGKWVQIIQEFVLQDQSLAVEGRLVYRFYQIQGRPVRRAEVEVNDLVII